MHENRIYYQVIKRLIEHKSITKNAKVLVICGGQLDEEILRQFGFKNVLITNLSKEKYSFSFKFRKCDAHDLPFRDNSFDYTIVHAGLHHCHFPHKALAEMYRVAKKGVLVCEAQDNIFTRLLVRFKLTEEYETISLLSEQGGADNTQIPNYVYRWSKREVEKFVRSLDFTKEPAIDYFAKFDFPPCFAGRGMYKGVIASVAKRFATLMNAIAPQRGNLLCFYIDKQKMRYHPWIKTVNKNIIFSGQVLA